MIPAQPTPSGARPPDTLPIHLPRHVLFCKTRLFVHLLTLKTHFVRDFPQKVKVEDVKTKLLCETSLQKRKWKMWKRSFRARHPSESESGRCENEAFVRDIPPKAKVEDVKTKISCETSHKISELKMWKRSFWCWDSGDSVIVVIVW